MSLRTRIAAVAGVAVAVTVIAAAVTRLLRRPLEPARRGGGRADRARGRARPSRRPSDRGCLSFPDREPVAPPRRARIRAATARGGPRRRGRVRAADLASGEVERPPGAEGELPVEPFAREIAESGSGRDIRDETVDDIHLMVLTEGVGEDGAIQVARPLTEVDNVLDEVLVALILVGVAGIALAAVLGALVARAALEPIARFTRRTEAIAAEPDVTERMEVVGRDELARLAESFNTTLDALERAVEAQRQLVADASHELRTPIASLRANIQTLEEAERLPAGELAALRADIVAELDELTALVERRGRARARQAPIAGARRRAARRARRRTSSSRPGAGRTRTSRSRPTWSRRSSAVSPTGSHAPCPTCSTTRASGARRAGPWR